MHKIQDRPETGRTVLQFLDWVYTGGQQYAEALDYVPMPANVVKLVETTWTQIKAPSGQSLWAAAH
jgi:phosphate transport system substrate-binding protein